MADTGIADVRQRVAQGTTDAAGSKCPNCVKQGLAILPVVSGILPNSILTQNQFGPMFTQPHDPLAGNEMESLSNGLAATDLTSHWYYMRTPPAGYIYIFDNGKNNWHKGYLVDGSGLLREMPVADLLPDPASVAPLDTPGVCERKEHNNLALQFFVLDPVNTPKVQVAFSRYRWSRKVLEDYLANQEGIRDRRMWSLDVAAAAKNDVGRGQTVSHARSMSADLGKHVADYSMGETRNAINQQQLEPLRDRGVGPSANIVATGALLRTGVVSQLMATASPAADLAKLMAKASESTEGKTGIVLLMDDAVGVTAQLNFSRNQAAGNAAITSGMGDPDRARRRVVADVIEGIRASAEANPGPWWNSNYGPERYLRHIDEGAWSQARAESAELKSLLARAEQISQDYVVVKESPRWNNIQRFDFDPGSAASALDHEQMVAWCVTGSGLCKDEREKVWYPVLALSDTDPDNWLSRALSAQNQGMQELMQAAAPDFGKKLDAVKNAKVLAAELLVGSDGRMGAIESVNKLRLQIRADRAANAATSALVESASNAMARLLQTDPERYHRLLRKITIAGLVRDDLVPQPVVVRGTWAKIQEWIMEVMTGPVRVDPRAAVSMGPMLTGTEYMRTRGNLRSGGWNLSQSVNGAVLYAAPDSQAETASVVFWVVNKVETGVTFNAGALGAFGLSEIDTTIPSRVVPDNPVLRNHLNRVSLHADGMLNSVALVFQAHGFYTSLLKFKQGKGDLGEGVKLVGAVLAASGAGLELVVAAQALRSAQATAGRIALMKAAAKLGMWAGVADGVYSILQAWKKLGNTDRDSALWSFGSGAATIAGSVAGFGLAAAGVSAAAGGAGTATVLGITMGPVGWVLLAIAFLGLAIYCAIQAFGTDDSELSPVEYWLDNGVFGKRARISGDYLENNPFVDRKTKAVPSFASLNDELYQLQRITLVAQAMFNSMSASTGADVSAYTIALPRYAEGTSLAVTFYGYVDGKRVEVSSFRCEDGAPEEQRFRERVNLTGGSGKPTIKVDPSGAACLTGRLGSGGSAVGLMNFLQDLFGEGEQYVDVDDFGMELLYKPDRHRLPELETLLRFPVARR